MTRIETIAATDDSLLERYLEGNEISDEEAMAAMKEGMKRGAIFPLFAAMTADYFGENNNATNYGLVYSSKLVSGLVGAGLGAVVVDTWGYGTAFAIAGSVGIACAFLSILLRQPKLPTPAGVAPIDVGPIKERALVVD